MDVSPDGEQFLITKEDPDAIGLVQDSFEDLKARVPTA